MPRSRLSETLLKWPKLHKLDEDKTFFFLTLLAGILCGVMAVLIHLATQQLTEWIGSGRRFELSTFLWGGLFVAVSGYITTRIDKTTSGSGIPFIRVWMVARNGYIATRQWLLKLTTTLLTLSSGLSVGREGPTVAISAGLSSTLANLFAISKKRTKELVAVGSAGGLSAAFNTPMAAVIFTLEEIVGDLNAKILGSIIISSVVASYTSTLLLGEHSIFNPLKYSLQNPYQLIVYLVIGLSAAVLGPLWVASVLGLRRFAMKWLRGHRLTFMMLAFIVMGLMSLQLPQVLGSGHQVINQVLTSSLVDWKMLIVLMIFKFLATTLTYSSGVCGGLFMPTLFIGAMLGGFLGSVGQELFPHIVGKTGSYALVGMGAYFASVIRSPFTSILMIFELTQDYHIILPLMIANITSYVVSARFNPSSIYERLAEQDGIHLPTREDDEILDQLHVEDAMIWTPKCLTASMSLQEALSFAEKHPFTGFPVLKWERLFGVISHYELRLHAANKGPETPVGDVCTKRPITIHPDQSLLVAFHKLQKHQISRLPVVSRLNDKELLGVITAEDIVARFGFHIQEESDEQKPS